MLHSNAFDFKVAEKNVGQAQFRATEKKKNLSQTTSDATGEPQRRVAVSVCSSCKVDSI